MSDRPPMSVLREAAVASLNEGPGGAVLVHRRLADDFPHADDRACPCGVVALDPRATEAEWARVLDRELVDA